MLTNCTQNCSEKKNLIKPIQLSEISDTEEIILLEPSGLPNETKKIHETLRYEYLSCSIDEIKTLYLQLDEIINKQHAVINSLDRTIENSLILTKQSENLLPIHESSYTSLKYGVLYLGLGLSCMPLSSLVGLKISFTIVLGIGLWGYSFS